MVSLKHISVSSGICFVRKKEQLVSMITPRHIGVSYERQTVR